MKSDQPREVIEAALAHVVRNRVEVAYARSDLFKRRRVPMEDWARYFAQGTVARGGQCESQARSPKAIKARLCRTTGQFLISLPQPARPAVSEKKVPRYRVDQWM